MVKTSKGEGTGLIPSQQTKIPHTRDVTKNLKKKNPYGLCFHNLKKFFPNPRQ